MLTISGTNFKDRGTVTLNNSVSVVTCATPPLGQTGNEAGPYWKPDGTLVKCLLPAGTGLGYGIIVLARSILGTISALQFSYDAPSLSFVYPVSTRHACVYKAMRMCERFVHVSSHTGTFQNVTHPWMLLFTLAEPATNHWWRRGVTRDELWW
jgi:hypothetical protein